MAFQLPNKKVKVKPNFDNAGWIKNPKHVAFFKVEGAYESYPVAMDRSGKLKNPLTKEEKDFLEKELGYENNELSVYNKNGVLAEMNIRLTKDPLELNLEDPFDYLRYKVLLTCSDKIAPSVKERKAKQTYKFYIEDEQDLISLTKEKANFVQQAWKEYGKMEDEKLKLIAFLKVYGQVMKKPVDKVDINSKIDFLQSKVVEIVEANPKAFVELVTSEDFDTILLIASAVETGVLRKDGTKYSIPDGGDHIGNTLKEAIAYLKAPVNQDLVFTLEEQIKLKK
jgi:hypothetical protein